MASWLARSTSEQALRVRALAGDIVLCSWVRHFTLTVPLFTQVYKWVPANLMLGVTLRWTSIPSRREKKYSQSLHATETGISSGLMGHLARMETLPFFSVKSHEPVGKFAELLSAPYADLKGIRLESAATWPKPFQLSSYYSSFRATQS